MMDELINEENGMNEEEPQRKRTRKRGEYKENGKSFRRNDRKTCDYNANQKRLDHIEFLANQISRDVNGEILLFTYFPNKKVGTCGYKQFGKKTQNMDKCSRPLQDFKNYWLMICQRLECLRNVQQLPENLFDLADCEDNNGEINSRCSVGQGEVDKHPDTCGTANNSATGNDPLTSRLQILLESTNLPNCNNPELPENQSVITTTSSNSNLTLSKTGSTECLVGQTATITAKTVEETSFRPTSKQASTLRRRQSASVRTTECLVGQTATNTAKTVEETSIRPTSKQASKLHRRQSALVKTREILVEDDFANPPICANLLSRKPSEGNFACFEAIQQIANQPPGPDTIDGRSCSPTVSDILAEFEDWCDETERNKSPAGHDELLTLRPISSQQTIRSQNNAEIKEKSSSSTKANVTSTNELERFSVTPSRTMKTGEEIRGYLTNKTISDSRQPFGEISEPVTLPISTIELPRGPSESSAVQIQEMVKVSSLCGDNSVLTSSKSTPCLTKVVSNTYPKSVNNNGSISTQEMETTIKSRGVLKLKKVLTIPAGVVPIQLVSRKPL